MKTLNMLAFRTTLFFIPVLVAAATPVVAFGQSAHFQGLGQMAGYTTSELTSISADGTVLAGTATGQIQRNGQWYPQYAGFTITDGVLAWIPQEEPQVGHGYGIGNIVLGLSGDGSTLLLQKFVGGNWPGFEIVRWDGTQFLPGADVWAPEYGDFRITRISFDGSSLFYRGYFYSYSNTRNPPSLPYTCLSRWDDEIISISDTYPYTVGARTGGAGILLKPDGSTHFPSELFAMGGGCELPYTSSDGSIINFGPWMWSPITRIYTPVRGVPTTDSNADGSIWVGGHTVWTFPTGPRDVSCLLRQLGSPATGWTQLIISGVSYDGKTIVGYGMNPQGVKEGWYAYIDSVPHGPDFDDNGGVNGDDIGAFFNVWESGDPKADLNGDGGIDATDIDTFFMMWESGAC